MAARTIEPAIGASTCALGSHRCSPYRGIFTMKAIMHASHRMVSLHEVFRGSDQYWARSIFSEPVEFCRQISAIRRGSDPTRV